METVWFGKCIFISWYCDLASCRFCFRSHNDAKAPEDAKRSMASILSEAFIAKQLGWRIEFLTGGCESVKFDELLSIVKNVSNVYEKKIWLNLGIFDQKQLEELRPYVEGICASVETTAMPLHDEVCPDKPLEPYEHLLQSLKGFKRSCCIIIGIGEQKKDLDSLLDFIDRNKLDRITFYALKPVKGSPYKESPDPDYYAWWIEETRKRFPKLEIMAGLTPKKVDYAEKVIRAGANGLTKFPAIRKFNSKEAADVERGVKNAGKKLDSSLTKLPKLDWMAEIDKLDLDNNIKQEMKKTVPMYLKKMEKK